MPSDFIATFRQLGAPPERGKYLSRLFGIFSEDIVRAWTSDPRAPYEDLGRPTIHFDDEKRGHTLDFTFRCRSTGRTYPAEMKCEIEYQNYKYLVLTHPSQVARHQKPAFAAFRAAAKGQPGLRTYVGKRLTATDGAILIWGAVSHAGRSAAIAEFGFAAILSIAEIVADLQQWRNDRYTELVSQRRAWSQELYDALAPQPNTAA